MLLWRQGLICDEQQLWGPASAQKPCGIPGRLCQQSQVTFFLRPWLDHFCAAVTETRDGWFIMSSLAHSSEDWAVQVQGASIWPGTSCCVIPCWRAKEKRERARDWIHSLKPFHNDHECVHEWNLPHDKTAPVSTVALGVRFLAQELLDLLSNTTAALLASFTACQVHSQVTFYRHIFTPHSTPQEQNLHLGEPSILGALSQALQIRFMVFEFSHWQGGGRRLFHPTFLLVCGWNRNLRY